MALDITTIDKNFLEGSEITRTDIAWRNALQSPFSIHGLAVVEEGKFWRLPEYLIDNVSPGISTLARHTAGGRIRFRTDSPFIAYRSKSFGGGLMPHMPLTGSSGADIFVNGVSLTTFRPSSPRVAWFEGIVNLSGEGMKDIEINLGLYNGVHEIWIGVQENASVTAPRPYTIEKPIVYYGSSITQGGCASKPGNSYQGFLTRWLDADQINLGFSGNAKGEPCMAEYIASLDMSVLVIDYDHNAPNVEHLEKTYYPFYRIIRDARPDLPIIMVTRPSGDKDPADAALRRDVIYHAYERARRDGEKVWFVDGSTLWGGRDRDACTMDGSHPNDLGFYRMAEGLLPSIRAALASIK